MTPMTFDVYEATWVATVSELMKRDLALDNEVVRLDDLSNLSDTTLYRMALGGCATLIMQLDKRIRDLEEVRD